MPMIPEDVLREVRNVDALSWMQSNMPGELKRISGNNYCSYEHDSLKVNEKGWYWFSRGFGGYSALDYLTKVKDYSFPDAVKAIAGISGEKLQVSEEPKEDKTEKPQRTLLVPELEKYPVHAKAYLMERGISESVVNYCIENSLVFETRKYHNVLFVGYDKDGIARYGAMRGTGSDYKKEVAGSDKKYAFSVNARKACILHLFESPIDLLSYATMAEMAGESWKRYSLLSLGGVAGDKVPVALKQFLEDHPDIYSVRLHLDNDEPGMHATASIIRNLQGTLEVLDETPVIGKDVNDTLLYLKSQTRKKEEMER